VDSGNPRELLVEASDDHVCIGHRFGDVIRPQISATVVRSASVWIV
jgi:hypothetical protein